MSRLLSRLKGIALSSPSKLKTTHSSPRDAQIFKLPEILEIIFAYLSPHKRRTVVGLVCKHWFAIVRRLALPTDFVWDIKVPKEQRLLALQHVITSPSRTLIFRGDNNHREAVDLALQELRQVSTGSSSMATLFKLRELVMDSSISRNLTKTIEILKLTGRGLRILRLVQPQRVLPETLAAILVACPQLNSLSILMHPGQRALPLTRDQVVLNDESPSILSAAMTAQRPLRTLVLQQPVMSDTLLKLILSLTHLAQLQILDRVSAGVPAEVNGPPIAGQADMVTFLAQLSSACPLLYRLQLPCNQRDDGATPFMLLNRNLSATLGASSRKEDVGIDLANLKELSFQDTEISGGDTLPRSNLMLAMLAPLTNTKVKASLSKGRPRLWAFGHLTRLEILPQNSEGCLIPSFKSLHTFLCHAPTLEHLITPNVMVDYEDLDWELVLPLKANEYAKHSASIPAGDIAYENVRGVSNSGLLRAKREYDVNKGSQSHRKLPDPPTHVWACRRLRTLHIAFPEPSWPDNAWSLILFGYISKACPRLEDLQITKETISLRPKDGLCLLGRLHSLERLTFVTTHVHFLDPRSSMEIQGDKKLYQTFDHELEWMRRFPKGYSGRAFETLSLGISFSSLEDKRQEIFEGRGTRISKNKNRDQGWDDLNFSILGTLKDVKDWKFERLRDLMEGQPLWPTLERLEIRYTNAEYRTEGRKLQGQLTRIRPDVKADIHYCKGKVFPILRIA